MSNINDVVIEIQKKKRGRPKGSKNKPKIAQIEIEENLIKTSFVKNNSIRPQRKATRRPSEMQFSIKPRAGGKCYYSTEITVDYTPQEASTERISIVPRLNIDYKPHIPGFIMEVDRTYYEKHDIRYQEEHKNKITDYSKPKDRLLQPKPGKRHNYCCVCKQSYDDYLDHVEMNQHKKAYNQNEFSKCIKDLHQEYESNFRQHQKHDAGEVYTETQQENDEIIDSSTTQKYITRPQINEKQHYHNNHNQHHSASNLSGITNPFPSAFLSQDIYRRRAYIQPMQEVQNQSHLHPLLNMKNQNPYNFVLDLPQMPLQAPHLSTSQSCMALNSKQTSSTCGSTALHPPLYPLNQVGAPNFYMNFPLTVGNENTNDLLMHQQLPQAQQLQDINFHMNNSHNSFNNNSNNNIGGSSRNIKNINNKNMCQINGKRKGEPFSDNIDCTRKQIVYQTQLVPSKIFDIIDDGTPEQKQSQIQNTVQTNIPTSQTYLRCPQNHCLV